MEEDIRRAISEVEDLNSRKLLKDIVEDVFVNLYVHSEDRLKEMKQRILEEISAEGSDYEITTSITEREKYDKTDTYFYPMDEKDLEEEQYDLEELKGCLLKQEKYPVFKLFFPYDYVELKKMLKNSRYWSGSIITEKKTCGIQLELEPDDSYEKQIEGLYKIFLLNHVPWSPVLSPYTYKMVKVSIIYCEDSFPLGDKIQEITIDMGRYAGHVKKGMVPLWNVKKVRTKTKGFAYPLGDRKAYVHKIPCLKENGSGGYLLRQEGQPWDEVRRSKEDLSILCGTDDSVLWHMIQICRLEKRLFHYYPLMGNGRDKKFLTHYGERATHPIHTRAELDRVFYSFPALEQMELVGHYFTEKASQGESYKTEHFLKDEVRTGGKRRMVFRVHPKEGSYLNRDLLSFFIAQIQLYFPEYGCEGELC